jgi:EAL domain-containing protein (putative c-di-GMP-specific phosphodiesterase class I)
MTADRVAESIVSGIASAAETLGMIMIAEHVETPEVAARLRELDVALGQGFHLGRPQPLNQAVQQAISQAATIEPAQEAVNRA